VLLEAVMHPMSTSCSAPSWVPRARRHAGGARAGKRVALANKESLVSRRLVAEAARQGGASWCRWTPAQCGAAVCHRAQRQAGAAHPDSIGRPVPRLDRGAGGAGDGGAGAQSPDVAHGEQDHGGQCHAREQGARGDRSALPVRPVIRPGGRRRASAEHRACLRGVL
jgi:hypothetical protein